VTSDGLTALSYNLENHLADRALKGVTLDYTYTADGRLIRSERGDTGVVTEIVLDIAGRRLAKLEGGTWRDYVYLGDQLLGYFDDGAAVPVQVIADHIGMPMMAVDGSGTVIWQAKAEPYGELRGEVGLSADPGLRYPGQWQDELDLEAVCVGDTCTMLGPLEDSFSLFENGYRWYKPEWGRYGQADPYLSEGISTALYELLNPYSYARSSPLMFSDEMGQFPDRPKSLPACVEVPCGIYCMAERAGNLATCSIMFDLRNVNTYVMYGAEVAWCQKNLTSLRTAWKYGKCLEAARKRREAVLKNNTTEFDDCKAAVDLIYDECMRNFDCSERSADLYR
jgi:RHS repeat-associated protein